MFPELTISVEAEYDEGFIRESEWKNGECTFHTERQADEDGDL